MVHANAQANVQIISLVAPFNRHGEILLLKRPDEVPCGGLWSLPGGKVEEDEMPLQAAVRELKEETGLQGKRWRHLGKASHAYGQQRLNFLFFVCFCPDLATLDCESPYAWYTRDMLQHLMMPEANAKLTPMLLLPEVDDFLSQCKGN